MSKLSFFQSARSEPYSTMLPATQQEFSASACSTNTHQQTCIEQILKITFDSACTQVLFMEITVEVTTRSVPLEPVCKGSSELDLEDHGAPSQNTQAAVQSSARLCDMRVWPLVSTVSRGHIYQPPSLEHHRLKPEVDSLQRGTVVARSLHGMAHTQLLMVLRDVLTGHPNVSLPELSHLLSTYSACAPYMLAASICTTQGNHSQEYVLDKRSSFAHLVSTTKYLCFASFSQKFDGSYRSKHDRRLLNANGV